MNEGVGATAWDAGVEDGVDVGGEGLGGGEKLAVLLEEVADLIEPAGGDHRLGAGVDSAVEGVPVPEQAEPEAIVAHWGCGPS